MLQLRCRSAGAYTVEVAGVLGPNGPRSGPNLLAVTPDGGWRLADPVPGWPADVRLPGLFAAPALADAHVHLHPELRPADYLEHGVARIRDLGSRLEDAVPDPDDCADPLPEVVAGGPMLDRPGQRRLLISAPWDRPEELPGLLDAAAERGARWVKLYEGFPVELFGSTVRAAHQRGLRVAVHPAPGDYRAAVDAGVDELEHLACLVPEGPAGTHALLARWADRRPGDRWPELPEGTSVCPTLLVQHRLVAEARRGWTFDGQDPAMARFWRSSAIVRRPWTPTQRDVGERAVEALRQCLAELDAAGVSWIVGSDTPNPGLAPGRSLWQEMNLLVDAGLDRGRVYRSAAVAPAMADTGTHPVLFLPEDALAGPFPERPVPALLLRGCLYRPSGCRTEWEEDRAPLPT